MGCSIVCFTPPFFWQTFFWSGDMVVFIIHHSNTRALTSSDITSNHFFLVVPNQKSKPPLSIRKCCLQFRTHLLNNPRCWATSLPFVRVDTTKVPKSSLAVTCLVVCSPTRCAKTLSLILWIISWLFIESCRLDKHFWHEWFHHIMDKHIFNHLLLRSHIITL